MKTRFTFFFFVFTICTSTAITVKAQVDVQDSLALVDLYNSTNGPEWAQHTNWLIGKVSTWYGVTLTNDNKRVRILYLEGNSLVGSLPPELDNLTNLEELYLSNNQLSGSIPPELGNLINLTDLYLNNNQLSGSIPPELGNLINLWGLDLAYNQLSGSIPPELGNLPNLRYLYLFNNQLSGSIPSELGNLTNLFSELDLSNNQLSGSIPSEFENFTNLYLLYLSNNQLSGSIPPEIGNLTGLSELDLSNNQLSGSIPPELGNSTNLEYLVISDNKLSGSIPPELGKLTNLYYLDISDNKLSGSIPPELGKLSNLYYYLYLYNNRFSFNGMELIAQTFPFAKYNTQAILTPHINGNAISVSAGGTLSNNTYTWYKKGQAGKTRITGDSVFHPTESGVYAVRVQNSIARHLNLFSDTISYTAPIALNSFSAGNAQENVNNNFSVYPNPVKDVLNIHAGGSASFSLLDQSGKILLAKNITRSGSMNVSNLAVGVYYLKNNNAGDVKKVVIAR